MYRCITTSFSRSDLNSRILTPESRNYTDTHTHTHTHQCDDGALCGELRSAEQRPDEAVDLLLLWVVLLVVLGHLRLLEPSERRQNDSAVNQGSKLPSIQ